MFSCCVNTATNAEDTVQPLPGVDDRDGVTQPVVYEKVEDPIVEEKKEEPPVYVEPEPVKEPEPLPIVEEVGPKPVEMVFTMPNGQTTIITIETRPLGLWFEKQVPVTVGRVRGEFAAGKAGVLPGWKIQSINGKDLTKVPKYQDAMNVVDESVRTLPLMESGKEIDIICTENGKDQTFTLAWKPLGLEFERKVPITVKTAKPGAYGVLVGIKPGMQFKSIGGVDLAGAKTYDEALDKLKAGVANLPSLSDDKLKVDQAQQSDSLPRADSCR